MSHEEAAAYALGALDEEERSRFEQHLANCPACAEEIETLRSAAASLAFLAEGPPAPPELRDRIIEQAVAERAVVVPLRRRIALPLAAAAGIAAAVGLGIWAAALSRSLDHERSARRADGRALAILAAPATKTVPLAGADGRLVVSTSGDAALVVRSLPAAPSGKAYEIWVIAGTGKPAPAGLFAGGPVTAVALTRPVPDGARVAVTLERSRGAPEPTGTPLLRTQPI